MLVYELCFVIWFLPSCSSAHFANPTGMIKTLSGIEQKENPPQETREGKMMAIYIFKIFSLSNEHTYNP